MKKIFRYCDDCKKVVRTDLPECVHYGAFKAGKNSESVTVIFRSPDGKVSIPWEPNTPCPAGYTREEIRGARAVRKLEKELDARDYKRFQNFQRKKEILFGPRRQQSRDDLKQIIRDGTYTIKDSEGRVQTRHVTQFGRDLARTALQRMDSGYTPTFEAGNYRRD